MKFNLTKKKLRKEKLTDLDPKRVSIVKTPANLNGFKHVMFSDNNYSVQSVVFDSDVYTVESAKSYLEEKGFTDFEVHEVRKEVEGVELVHIYSEDEVHQFSDVRAVKIDEDNVTFYIGISDSENEFVLPTAKQVEDFSDDPFDDEEEEDDEDEDDDWDEEDEEEFDETELESLLFSEGFKPTVRMQRAAKKALSFKSSGYKGGTKKSKMRAEKIAMGEALSLKEVRELNSFMEKRLSFKDTVGFSEEQEGYPNKQAVTWLMNGGDAGYTFSNRVKKAYQVGKMMKKSKKMSLDFSDVLSVYDEKSFTSQMKYDAANKAVSMAHYRFESAIVNCLVGNDREMVMRNAVSYAIFVMGIYDFINSDSYVFSDYEKQYLGDIKPGTSVSFTQENNLINGKVDRIIYSGNLSNVNSEFSLEASESEPVALIDKFEFVDGQWDSTGLFIEQPLLKLTKVEKFMEDEIKDIAENEVSDQLSEEAVSAEATPAEPEVEKSDVSEQLSALVASINSLNSVISSLDAKVNEKFSEVDVAIKQIADKVPDTLVVKPLQGSNIQGQFSETPKKEPLTALEALFGQK